MITTAPTGKIIQGHVLDANETKFVQALRQYDKQLYVKWNPKKVQGWGCWEIRMRPRELKIKDYVIWKDNAIVLLDYVELDVVNHVLDCAYLNYDQIRKLKEMDTWKKNHWIHRIEEDEADRQAKIKKDARDELTYNIRHHKKMFQDYKDLVRKGVSPASVLIGPKRKY